MPETHAETFGEAVRRLREAMGISQADLAYGASLSQSTVSRVERDDDRATDPDRYAAILWTLGVSAEHANDLLTGYPEETRHRVLARIGEFTKHKQDDLLGRASPRRPFDLRINLGEYLVEVDVKVTRFDSKAPDPRTHRVREEVAAYLAAGLHEVRPEWIVAVTAPVGGTTIPSGVTFVRADEPAGGGAPPIPGETGRRLSGQGSTGQDPPRARSDREPDSRQGEQR